MTDSEFQAYVRQEMSELRNRVSALEDRVSRLYQVNNELKRRTRNMTGTEELIEQLEASWRMA